MHSLRRILPFSPSRLRIPPPSSSSYATCLSQEVAVLGRRALSARPPSSPSAATGDDEWNDAWETAWLPEDPSTRDLAPWEPDPTSPSAAAASLPSDIDADTKAFVAEMDERWSERRSAKKLQQGGTALERVEKNSKKGGDDYRVRKQRIHAGLWMKEIEKMEEVKLGGSNPNDDIDRLLDSCSEIFDAGNMDLNDSKIPSTAELKSRPDGWETTSRSQDGNVWEMSQREEDILLQEFERRIAFCKFQIASFIKTHIFSRRRPVDGWKYMIEVIGPNARRGKGSVQRLPGLTDPSTQPYKEEKPPAIGPNLTSFGGR